MTCLDFVIDKHIFTGYGQLSVCISGVINSRVSGQSSSSVVLLGPNIGLEGDFEFFISVRNASGMFFIKNNRFQHNETIQWYKFLMIPPGITIISADSLMSAVFNHVALKEKKRSEENDSERCRMVCLWRKFRNKLLTPFFFFVLFSPIYWDFKIRIAIGSRKKGDRHSTMMFEIRIWNIGSQANMREREGSTLVEYFVQLGDS
mmetsp:Transcript_40474/g.46408  ORF Transcript_40474/g.46408 Transcript_40474/m.46408 type:complete len:204 (+) Transcript_40474:1291-1902(+)